MNKTKAGINLFRHEDIRKCNCIQSEFMFFNQQLASAYCVQIIPEVSSRYIGSLSKEEPKIKKKKA